MVPDLVLICENMLMSEGFMKAKALASKFHGLYSLLQELLSKQVKTARTVNQKKVDCSMVQHRADASDILWGLLGC